MKTRNVLATLGLGLALTAAVVGGISKPNKVYAAEEVTIDETNFPNKKFRSYVKEEFDTDGNGVLSSEEISAVDEINVNYEGISNLQGIEYFTNITKLQCIDNKLTKLDVSKNTKLKELYCGRNKLTKLDVSGATKLTYLDCYNNKLTKLNVSKNTKLKELYCDSNKLTKLDVTKNTKLEVLACGSNKLTKLDVSKNTKLKELGCRSNKLTKLNVSKNTKLYVLSCDKTVKVTKGKNSELTISRE
jgi:Leucine-rich repeat (LRR) protein